MSPHSDVHDSHATRERAARDAAVAAGEDPDEVVSYGPPSAYGDRGPVEREAPIWMLFDETFRARLA